MYGYLVYIFRRMCIPTDDDFLQPTSCVSSTVEAPAHRRILVVLSRRD